MTFRCVFPFFQSGRSDSLMPNAKISNILQLANWSKWSLDSYFHIHVLIWIKWVFLKSFLDSWDFFRTRLNSNFQKGPFCFFWYCQIVKSVLFCSKATCFYFLWSVQFFGKRFLHKRVLAMVSWFLVRKKVKKYWIFWYCGNENLFSRESLTLWINSLLWSLIGALTTRSSRLVNLVSISRKFSQLYIKFSSKISLNFFHMLRFHSNDHGFWQSIYEFAKHKVESRSNNNTKPWNFALVSRLWKFKALTRLHSLLKYSINSRLHQKTLSSLAWILSFQV